MRKTAPLSEATILEKLVSPKRASFDARAARALLTLRFDRDTTQHIRRLLQKNNRGTIDAEERLELEKYLRVGQFVDLVHAKALSSLKEQGESV